jgi:hypothetical protein
VLALDITGYPVLEEDGVTTSGVLAADTAPVTSTATTVML